MNKGVLIALVIGCCLLVSSSISGGLYYFRCDLGLVGCPSPEPAPAPAPAPAPDPPYLVCKNDGFYRNRPDDHLEKIDYPYEGDHHKYIESIVAIERLEDIGHTNVGSCAEISNELVLYKVDRYSGTIYCAPLDKLDNPDDGFIFKDHDTDPRCP